MATIDNVDTDVPTYFNKQAELLMEILHDLKHSVYEDITSSLTKYFPHWRCVEFYGPDKGFTAVEYLFNAVLLLE